MGGGRGPHLSEDTFRRVENDELYQGVLHNNYVNAFELFVFKTVQHNSSLLSVNIVMQAFLPAISQHMRYFYRNNLIFNV